MNANQKQRLQAFLRVQSFLAAANPGDATGDGSDPKDAEGPQVAKHREALAEVIGRLTRLTRHAVDQDATVRLSRAETRRKASLRRALRLGHMRPIAALARVVLGESAGQPDALRMPPAQADTLALIAAAGAMAAAVAPHRATFVEHGLATDFVERLAGAADAVRQAMVTRSEHAARRAGATAGVAADLERGRRLVQLLDAFVAPRLEGDPSGSRSGGASSGWRGWGAPPAGRRAASCRCRAVGWRLLLLRLPAGRRRRWGRRRDGGRPGPASDDRPGVPLLLPVQEVGHAAAQRERGAHGAPAGWGGVGE